MDSTSDEALIRAFNEGDDAALGELARRYETSLLGLASGLLGGRRDLASDVVQETWMRVIRYGSGFNGRSSAKTWLFRIMMNRARDLRRKNDRQPEPTETRKSEPVARDEDRDDALRQAVGRLAQPKREAVLLCYHHDLTHEQAADILEIPVGTVKSRLHAALEELRVQLPREAT